MKIIQLISKIFVIVLILISTTALVKTSGSTKAISYQIPDNALMSFSYELNVKSFAQLVNENDRDQLKPHQKFQFVPKTERMFVQGYLRSDGYPHIEINILEKSNKPWLQKTLSNSENEIKPKELKKIVIDNGLFTAFDERGEKIYEKREPLFRFKDKADAFLKNLDAEKVYKEMLASFIKRGANVTTDGKYINISYDLNGLNYHMELMKDKALPVKSIVKSKKEITTTTYTFKCIDGKWVLVVTKTKIEPNRENTDLTDVAVLTNFITKIDNVQINTH